VGCNVVAVRLEEALFRCSCCHYPNVCNACASHASQIADCRSVLALGADIDPHAVVGVQHAHAAEEGLSVIDLLWNGTF
jgi:hypothetical protein